MMLSKGWLVDAVLNFVPRSMMMMRPLHGLLVRSFGGPQSVLEKPQIASLAFFVAFDHLLFHASIVGQEKLLGKQRWFEEIVSCAIPISGGSRIVSRTSRAAISVGMDSFVMSVGSRRYTPACSRSSTARISVLIRIASRPFHRGFVFRIARFAV